MSDEKLKDQFHILFDDVEGENEENPGGIETVKMVDFDNLDTEIPKHAKPENEAPKAPLKVERETQEDRLKRFSYEMGEEEEEDDLYKNVPKKQKETGEKKKKSDYKTESIRFLIFTIIIALLALGAIFFILFSRGIIGGGSPKESSVESEIVSTSEEESSSEEKTDDESSSEESSTEESETEEPSTEVSGHREVLQNYTNLFVVTASKLNVRETASTDARIIATMTEYSAGNVLDEQGDWYHINSGGIVGYVSKEYCVTGAEAETIAVRRAKERVAVTGDAVRVRAESNTSSNILATVSNGTLFDYLGEENGFNKVARANEYTGYISKDFSKVDYYLDSAVVSNE